MHAGTLDRVPLGLLFVALCAASWVALEGGSRLGKWRHARTAEEKEAPVGAMLGTILGLRAFLLSFTFGLAANRFDARRQPVLEEATPSGRRTRGPNSSPSRGGPGVPGCCGSTSPSAGAASRKGTWRRPSRGRGSRTGCSGRRP